jgi:Ca2+-transporting ATPase
MTLAVLGAFLGARHGLGYGPEATVAVSFLGLALAQLLHVFNMRTERSLLRNEIARSPAVWWALLVCVVFLGAAVAIPALAEVLHLRGLDARGWGLVVAAGFGSFALGQVPRALAARDEEVGPRRARSAS